MTKRDPGGAASGLASGWRRYHSLALVLCFGLLGTYGVFHVLRAREQERKASEFARLAEDRARAIQRNANGCLDLLFSVGDLYASSERVDAQEFHVFAERVLTRHPAVQSLEWLPRVHAGQREMFERLLGRLAHRSSGIFDLTNKTGKVRAGERPEYFPVLFLEPTGQRAFYLGFDHYADRHRRAVMDQACASGLPTASAWLKLPVEAVPGDAEENSVVVYLPIYTNRQSQATADLRRRHLAGYVCAMVPVPGLVDNALRHFGRGEIAIFLDDGSEGPGNQVLGYLDRVSWLPNQSLAQLRPAVKNAIVYEGAVDIGGQTWNMVCLPTRKFFEARRAWASWLVLATGLLLTGFFFKYQRSMMLRSEEIERQVAQRTAELQMEISERRRVEEELAQERDLFHTLLDNLPDRIYFKDVKSRFIRINRALADLFGLKQPHDAWGKTDFDFFTREHAQPAFDDEQAIIQSGQPLIGRVEFETLPNGKTGWAHTNKLPLRDKAGRIVGTFGISRDITEIKQMEARLAGERNLLRSLIEHLPDYVYVKDRQGRFLVANPIFCQVARVGSPDALIGKSALELCPAAGGEQQHADDLQVMTSGQTVANQEQPAQGADGKNRWFLVSKVPLREADERVVGLVCVGRDITARREVEDRLKQANLDLKKSHEELKAAQMQLIQAEKLQSVGRLAAGVAHEVKNPLSILGMGIDYLGSSVAPDDAVSLGIIQDMRAAIRRADNIILGLLDFSAPRDLKLNEESINQVIEHALNLTRHQQMGTLVRVERQLAPDLPRVKVDVNKITQVLVNIFLNALQAMDGGGTLTVRSLARAIQADEAAMDSGSRQAAPFRPGETAVVVEVDDTGPGIPPDKLGRLFDPFFTTKPTGQGTGLGLSVTRRIVELHGGAIRIVNRPEGGARVIILFKI